MSRHCADCSSECAKPISGDTKSALSKLRAGEQVTTEAEPDRQPESVSVQNAESPDASTFGLHSNPSKAFRTRFSRHAALAPSAAEKAGTGAGLSLLAAFAFWLLCSSFIAGPYGDSGGSFEERVETGSLLRALVDRRTETQRSGAIRLPGAPPTYDQVLRQPVTEAGARGGEAKRTAKSKGRKEEPELQQALEEEKASGGQRPFEEDGQSDPRPQDD